jgi:hypothetical protein
MSPHTASPRLLMAVLTGFIILQPLAFARPSGPQTDQRALIDVDDPRPLAAAAEILERRYGWVITYEDPPYVYPADIADVTAQVRRDLASNPRVLVPNGGPFRFTYGVPAVTSAAEASAILKGLLEEYHRSGHPGVFRLVQTGTTFHVVPSEAKNVQGISQATSSLLDMPISIHSGGRTDLQMLEAVVQALGRATGAKIWLGSAPLNLLMQTHDYASVTNAPARTVLMRMLEGTGQNLSWQVFCSPGPVRDCALNVHAVKKAASSQ